MDKATSLPPQILKQFAELAKYLGYAQKIALDISRNKTFGRKLTIPDLTPPKIIPSEDAWFWSEKWQAKEQEANEALLKGEYKGFDDVEEAITYLHKPV